MMKKLLWAVCLCASVIWTSCNGVADMTGGEGGINENGDPNIVVTGITFVNSRLSLRPGKTYEPRDFLDTVPSGGVLPSGIEFSVEKTNSYGGGYSNMMSSDASYRDGVLTISEYATDPQPYTLAATCGEKSATCQFYIEESKVSGTSDIQPSVASGKTYVTPNRIGGASSTTPWYAICFISSTQVRVGMCSVAQNNAIKLARGEKASTGSSHILEYTYDDGVYDLQGFIKAVGGECVIKDDVLTNYFFESSPTVFNLVK